MFKDIELKVKDIIKKNINAQEDIGLEENLEQYGLSSITFLKALIELEQEFNIEFDDTYMMGFEGQTISNILKYIYHSIGDQNENK